MDGDDEHIEYLASQAAVPGVIKIKAGFVVRAGSKSGIFPYSPHPKFVNLTSTSS